MNLIKARVSFSIADPLPPCLEEDLPDFHRQNTLVIEDGWDITDSDNDVDDVPKPAAPKVEAKIQR